MEKGERPKAKSRQKKPQTNTDGGQNHGDRIIKLHFKRSTHQGLSDFGFPAGG